MISSVPSLATHEQMTTAVALSLAQPSAAKNSGGQKAIAEAFFRRHPEAFIAWLTEYYPLTVSDMVMYQDRWDWEVLSKNKALYLTDECFLQFEDRWRLYAIFQHPYFPWSKRLLNKYGHHIIHWAHSDAERHHGVDESWAFDSWDPSVPWTDQLIERYKDQWNWKELSQNCSLSWSQELIARYIDRWEWTDLSKNQGLPWSQALIETYADRWDWRSLAENDEIPWSKELVKCYSDRWDWGGLPINVSGIWSEALLTLEPNRWDWAQLSLSESLPWSAEFLTAHSNRWNWSHLSASPHLPWSELLLRQFEDRWDWVELGKNRSIHWSEDLARKFIHRLIDVPLGMNVSVSFADQYQQLHCYEGVQGVFNRRPEFLSKSKCGLVCFNLKQTQVRRLMAEFFK